MKYVNLKSDKKILKAAEKEILDELGAKTRKRYRAKRVCTIIICVFLALLFLASMAFCVYVLHETEFAASDFFLSFSKVISGVGAFFISVIATVVFASILFIINDKIFSDVGSVEVSEKIRKGTQRKILNERYGMGDDFIVTKCFSSFAKDLEGRDVFVYPFGDKLRILDCYVSGGYIEVNLKDCSVVNPEPENSLNYGKFATVLCDGKDEVVLGKKAFVFIDNLKR